MESEGSGSLEETSGVCQFDDLFCTEGQAEDLLGKKLFMTSFLVRCRGKCGGIRRKSGRALLNRARTHGRPNAASRSQQCIDGLSRKTTLLLSRCRDIVLLHDEILHVTRKLRR